ncbi:MAG: hypothetical protein JSV89_17835 [Spirochaetaceae bacterium]|nr:MAG: hypothetical protein JSV89_17835 [Spirochaetaceae bacterium]
MAKQTAKEPGIGGINFLDHRTKAIFDFMAKAEKKTNRQFLDFLVWEYFKQKYANKGPGKESIGRKRGRKPGVRKTKAITGEGKAATAEST